ncbi:VanZ family protein [Haloarcula onubensis]|uniref:VanZ family protein n=1 Tax=Haloarcula onubensis TaxID=2950539 RepID=A0ABU2FV51_9EURY|nr:VanZ family protein [Halomicroarcula sp. S3CR25-11]MDS0284648.1 VanZ family protein [Halomicroarcula sp. S3CR25-11]
MTAHAASATPWRRALTAGLALLVGSLVPSPFDRREAFDTYGPDKWLHFLGHGTFAVTLADALAADGRGRAVAGGGAVGCSVLLGLTVGYLQRYVPGRVPELADLVAGALGSLFGVGWWYRRGR